MYVFCKDPTTSVARIRHAIHWCGASWSTRPPSFRSTSGGVPQTMVPFLVPPGFGCPAPRSWSCCFRGGCGDSPDKVCGWLLDRRQHMCRPTMYFPQQTSQSLRGGVPFRHLNSCTHEGCFGSPFLDGQNVGWVLTPPICSACADGGDQPDL